VGAFFGRGYGGGPAQTRGPAGDEDDFIFELFHETVERNRLSS
jgi:hypothetical protein